MTKKLKVAVYAIAKDEINNLDGWFNHASAADYVLLLDTGSTDGTVERARELGINVFEASISPWDEARAKNVAMSLLPSDIDFCVCVDLDEHIDSSDWINNFSDDLIDGIYLTSSIGRDGLNTFIRPVKNIHPRFGYYWKGFRSALHAYPGYKDNVLSLSLDITTTSVPGSQDRFDNRDPLYVQSFKNHVLMLEQERQSIPSSLQTALAYLALSYYEIEDYDSFSKTYFMFLNGIEHMSKSDSSLKFVELLDYARSMVEPSVAEQKLIEWYDKSTDPIVPLSRLIIFFTITKQYDKAKVYLVEYNHKIESLVSGRNKQKMDSVILVDQALIEAVSHCDKIVNSGLELGLKIKEILSVYSAIGWGKPHMDLALKAHNYAKI